MHHGSGVMQHHLHLSKLTRRITSSRYRYQFVSIKKNWGDNKNIQRSSLRRRGRGESRTISALDSNCVDKVKYYAISKFNSFLKNKKIRAVGIFIDSTFLERRDLGTKEKKKWLCFSEILLEIRINRGACQFGGEYRGYSSSRWIIQRWHFSRKATRVLKPPAS